MPIPVMIQPMTIAPGDTVEFKEIDPLAGQLTAKSKVEDLQRLDLTSANAIVGPIFVDGATVLVDTRSRIRLLDELKGKRVAVIPGTTTERSLAKRQKQQIYVDAMQNARGKTIASAYSARARDGGTVSMPLTWKQIEKGIKISDFTIENLPALIKKHGDAWADFFDSRQDLKLK